MSVMKKSSVVFLLISLLASLSVGCAPEVTSPPEVEFVDYSHRIAAGWGHSLVLTAEGYVVAWRASWDGNRYGQADVPDGLSDVVAVAAGETFSLALKANGEIVAWGEIEQPSEQSGFKAIAAGRRHALALREDGTVYAWGVNSHGQLDVPSGLNDVVGIAVGNNHCLAVTASGILVAWGENTTGQCDVPGIKERIIQVAGGWGHSVALVESGRVFAWGNDTMRQTRVPEAIQGKVQAVISGWWTSLAILNDGSVRAWGGYTGTGGNPENPRIVPEDLKISMGLAAGENHYLSVNADGSMRSWSYRAGGGANISDMAPTGISIFGESKYIALGPPISAPQALSLSNGGFNLVLRADGTLVGWGPSAPSKIDRDLIDGLSGVVGIAGSQWYPMAWLHNGRLVALVEPARMLFSPRGVWLEDKFVLVHVPEGLPVVVEVALSLEGAIAVTESGSIIEWGFIGTTSPSVKAEPKGPAEVAGLTDIVAVAAGDFHYLALKDDGTLFAWGDNTYGQVTIPPGGGRYRDIAAWGDISVAVRPDGTLVVWGQDHYDDLGRMRTDLIDVISVVRSYALLSNGDVFALWQENGAPPVITDAISIGTSVAILSDGRVVGLGPNATDIPPGLRAK